VLRLLAAGHSNREIARELVVAVGTVKTHVHNLCGKLGAPTRGRAVARARELGLLLAAPRGPNEHRVRVGLRPSERADERPPRSSSALPAPHR
jgi:hypothetical protein